MCVKCSSTSAFESLSSTVTENAKNCIFLFVELRCQLSSVLRCLKDKSTTRSRIRSRSRSISSSCVRFKCRIEYKCRYKSLIVKSCKERISPHAIVLRLLVIVCVSSVLSSRALIMALLSIGGIESNPGPAPCVAEKFRLLSQNCRGLTDRDKLIKLIRKIYPRSTTSKSVAGHTISCLQETHRIDMFAVDNLFKGKVVNDDGERNQRGVCILVPEAYKIVSSIVSGVGRWAIATIRPTSTQSVDSIVVATLYAPNCHRESHIFFQDFFAQLDEVTQDLALRNEAFNVIVCGDFNVVLNPDTGSVNRTSTRAEKDVAKLISDSMFSRALTEPDPLNQQQLYTWRRGTCLSKLDYVFISNSLSPMVASGRSWRQE